MKRLVISIVTWNSSETIRACVQSLLDQSFPDFTLLIVDNNSRDETCKLIEGFDDKRITLYKMKENTGFCGGHNFSISNSESEFVLLVNPDIILAKNYIEKALEAFKKDDAIGTVCGLLVQGDPNNPDSLIDSAGLEIKNSRIMRMRFHCKRRDE